MVGVLIVEDDELTRAVLADLLTDAGYVVFTATNGQPALERLRTHPTGLVVLLDLMMPGMDGYALLQVVAADSSLATQHAYYPDVSDGQNAPAAGGGTPAPIAPLLAAKTLRY